MGLMSFRSPKNEFMCSVFFHSLPQSSCLCYDTQVALVASITNGSTLDILFVIPMKIFTTFHCIVSLSPRAQDRSQDILLSGSG